MIDVPALDDLQSQYDDPWVMFHELAKDIADQVNEELEQRDDEIESELDNQSQNVSGAFAKLSTIDDRIEDLEAHAQQASADPSEGDESNANASDENDKTDTPLETICALLEHLAERELTANQERARFIAEDVRDYAENAPAGLVLDSQAIKRVITAKEGDRPHTQTVARIMDFLDRLGKDAVDLRKRRGRKLIAVDPEAADRLAVVGSGANHDRCDRGRGRMPTTDVISSA